MQNIILTVIIVAGISMGAYGLMHRPEAGAPFTRVNFAPSSDDVSLQTEHGYLGDYNPDLIKSAESGPVVLFFDQTLYNNLQASLGQIPEDLTILWVNKDLSESLKAKYKIESDNTLIQVDETGAEIGRWTGSENLDAILVNIQLDYLYEE